jgi:hypothetical protein
MSVYTADETATSVDFDEGLTIDTGDYASHADTGEESYTYQKCSADGCENEAFKAAPGSGKRSSKFCKQANCTKVTQGRTRDEADPFSSPLTSSEKRLAKQLELPFRLAGMGVYRANVIDGLIIGSKAEALAEAMVLEARVSKPVKQMCEAVAKFAGAGPIALVLIDTGLQIANNHKIPLVGDLKQVDGKILADHARIIDVRSKRATQAKAAAPADEIHEAATSQLMQCPNCGRRLMRQGETTQCVCGVVLNG